MALQLLVALAEERAAPRHSVAVGAESVARPTGTAAGRLVRRSPALLPPLLLLVCRVE